MSPIERTSAPGIAAAGPRVRPRTSWPSATRPRHNASPMKPAAPVTRMRARLDPPTLSLRPDSASDLGANALKRAWSQRKAGSARVSLSDPIPPPSTIAGCRSAAEASLLGDRGLVFLLASSAGRPGGARRWLRGGRRDAGARPRRRDPRRGFHLAPDRLAAARRRAPRCSTGDHYEIARLYRSERPDIVHHVALKPVLFGGIARRLAFARSADAPVSVDSVMGLGSGFSATTIAARLRRPPLGLALRLVAGGKPGLDRSAEPRGPRRSNRDWGRHRANCADQGIGDRHQPFSAAARAWRRYHHRGTRLAHAAR